MPERIAIVGRGLMGSAAARHLALAGAEVALIGPEEPTDWAAHEGPFASHYDEGRITRRLADLTLWSRLSTAAIGRYAEIEAASGISVFSDVGAVMAGPTPSEADPFMARVAAVASGEEIAADRLEGAALAARFPFFDFPAGTVAYHEPRGAGYLSPRRMVAAQTRAAAAAGAEVIRAAATRVRGLEAGVEIETAAGDTVAADRALVAAGGFSIDPQLGTGPLDLTINARTVAFLRLGAAEAARLAAMPSVVHKPAPGTAPGVLDWYLLPPIRYPDGAVYLKIGGDPADRRVSSVAEARDWFQSGGDPEVGAALTETIHGVLPGLQVEEVRIAPCVTTWTAHGRPYIGAGAHPRIGVLTGGNGAGAKCSDELGRLGARFALGQDLAPERYPEGFEVVFADRAAA